MTPALLPHNYSRGSVLFFIDGVRYEYIFPLNEHIRKCEAIYKKSPLAALNYAKRWAMRTEKQE